MADEQNIEKQENGFNTAQEPGSEQVSAAQTPAKGAESGENAPAPATPDASYAFRWDYNCVEAEKKEKTRGMTVRPGLFYGLMVGMIFAVAFAILLLVLLIDEGTSSSSGNTVSGAI